jgi:UDP:flavonoid glycosyltransferase YjiC (YdhE family)
VDYVRRAGGAWTAAVRAFAHVVTKNRYDVVVGDEAYEVAGALSAHPELRTAPFTMIYDFVGLDSMTWRPSERLVVHAVNRRWCGGHRGKRPGADLTLFIGEPEDVPDRRFGFLLPNRRDYARRYYEFVGYVFGFDPAAYADRASTRRLLGYDERPLVVCSIGGTSVGGDLLRLCAAAFPHVEARLPDVRMVLVCGPRLDPSTVRARAGVEVRDYVPRLYEHFAASDVVVTQGGGTTTLELTALRRPFVYFPLEGHFEQDRVVSERLARHRAGTRLEYSQTTPKMLAGSIVGLLGTEARWPPIATDGVLRAARLINKLMSDRRAA